LQIAGSTTKLVDSPPSTPATAVAAFLAESSGHFIMFSVITNIYSKKTIGPTLMELFTATGKVKKLFFNN
jgi:hypothetical protein